MLKFRRPNTSSSSHREENSMQDVRDRAQEFLQDIGENFSMTMSRDDMKSPRFWRAVLGEFLGTIILILFGCGSWIETDADEHPLTVRIAFTFGLLYGVVLYSLRPVSGGHINPTVTIAMVVTRQISLARAGFYCLAQIIGGIIGAALLLGFTPHPYRDILGCTKTAEELSAGQGFGIELITSFFYVFVVFSCYAKVDKQELIVYNLFTPFVIGFSAITIHLFAIPYTGAGINPARSFGPSVVTGNWKNHWIYWFGPIIGGTLGGVVQQTAFGRKASLNNLKTCMVTHEADGSNDKLATITSMSSLQKKPLAHSVAKESNNTYAESSVHVPSSLKKRGPRMEDISNETQSLSSSTSSYKKPRKSHKDSSIRSNKVSDSSLPSLTTPFPTGGRISEKAPTILFSGPDITTHDMFRNSAPFATTPFPPDAKTDDGDGVLASAFMASQNDNQANSGSVKHLWHDHSAPDGTPTRLYLKEHDLQKISKENQQQTEVVQHGSKYSQSNETEPHDNICLQANESEQQEKETEQQSLSHYANAGVQTVEGRGSVTKDVDSTCESATKDVDATSDFTTVTPLPSHMESFEEDGSVLSDSSDDEHDSEEETARRRWHDQSSTGRETNGSLREDHDAQKSFQLEGQSSTGRETNGSLREDNGAEKSFQLEGDIDKEGSSV